MAGARVGTILARAVAIITSGVDKNGRLLRQSTVRAIREHPRKTWAYSVHCGFTMVRRSGFANLGVEEVGLYTLEEVQSLKLDQVTPI